MKINFSILLLLLNLIGCSGLQPVKDTAKHHILDPLVTDRKLKASTPVIAIKKPAIPSYLNRQQLVNRVEGNLIISQFDLWAEPLEESIARVIASNLSRLTGSLSIQTVEDFTTLNYTKLVEIRIDQFEQDTNGIMLFQGTWKLQSVAGKESENHFFRFNVPITITKNSMTGHVQAMNQAIELLSKKIAANLEG